MARRRGDTYEGWRVVAGSASLLTLAVGSLVYGLSLLVDPLSEELGGSTFVVAIGFGLRSEVGGLAAPFVGSALDRHGPTVVVRVGVVCAAAGVLLLSFTTSLWQFVPAMLLIALGNTASGGQSGHHAVATWFRARRARAMSLLSLGGAAGGLMSLAVGFGVEEWGWRATVRALTVVVLVGGWTLSRFVRPRPDDHPQPVDGHAAEQPGRPRRRASDWEIPFDAAVRSRAMRQLLAFNLGIDFARISYLTHLANFVTTDIGARPIVAGVVMACSTIASVPGRLLSGLMADRHEPRAVAAVASVPFVAGVAVLSVATEPWHAMVGAVLGGIGFGATIPIRPAMYAEYFGLTSFGRVMGVGRLVSTTGGFVGAALVGLLVDVFDGDYTVAWLMALCVAAVAVPVALTARPPVELQAEHRVGAR